MADRATYSAFHRNAVLVRAVTSINPVTTVVLAPLHVTTYRAVTLFLEAINDDVAQSISLHVEIATAATGPWIVTALDALVGILPDVAASAVVDISMYEFVRVTATCTGAGSSARITATIYVA